MNRGDDTNTKKRDRAKNNLKDHQDPRLILSFSRENAVQRSQIEMGRIHGEKIPDKMGRQTHMVAIEDKKTNHRR